MNTQSPSSDLTPSQASDARTSAAACRTAGGAGSSQPVQDLREFIGKQVYSERVGSKEGFFGTVMAKAPFEKNAFEVRDDANPCDPPYYRYVDQLTLVSNASTLTGCGDAASPAGIGSPQPVPAGTIGEVR